MSRQDIKAQILDIIQGLQEGRFNPTDKARFDPSITGNGVGIWPLASRLGGIGPGLLGEITRELAVEGKIEIIDPDAMGLISFVAKKPANEQHAL